MLADARVCSLLPADGIQGYAGQAAACRYRAITRIVAVVNGG